MVLLCLHMWKCKKGVTWRYGNFYCTLCEMPVSFPKARFKLCLNVKDSIVTTTVTLFDDTAEKLVGATTDSLLKNHDESDDNVLPNGLANIINNLHTLEIKSYTYYSIGVESFTCTNILLAITTSLEKRPREEDASNLLPAVEASHETLICTNKVNSSKVCKKGIKKHESRLTNVTSQGSMSDGEAQISEDSAMPDFEKRGFIEGEAFILPSVVVTATP